MDQPTTEDYAQMFEQTHLAGQVGQQAQASASAQYYIQEEEKNLAEAQLDCQKTLNRIYHLLRQDVLRPMLDKMNNEIGKTKWEPLEDQSKRALTDEGVDRIMQVMESYINQETLLSNFDDKQISRRMLWFDLALNANFFMKYEVYFKQPSFEECKEILKQRIEEQVKQKAFAKEVIGIEPDIIQIRIKMLGEVEGRIEYEISKIRLEKMKQNLREYELLFTQLDAIVEATHNRAWRGEERGSLRRHTNVSEILGGRPSMSNPKQGGGFFSWSKG